MRFADTSFWFGLQERRDGRHQDARALVEGGIGRVLTTNHVIGETWTLIRRRSGHSAAVGFLERLTALPDVEVITSMKRSRQTLGAGSAVAHSASTRSWTQPALQ